MGAYIGELDKILATARRRNPDVNVTGAMLFNEDWFVQLLKGEEGDVRSTYDRIAADPRHEKVEMLVDGVVAIGSAHSRQRALLKTAIVD